MDTGSLLTRFKRWVNDEPPPPARAVRQWENDPITPRDVREVTEDFQRWVSERSALQERRLLRDYLREPASLPWAWRICDGWIETYSRDQTWLDRTRRSLTLQAQRTILKTHRDRIRNQTLDRWREAH